MKHIEAFTYLFRQPHFVMTLLVGSVMLFIPIVGPLVLMGWAVTVHHALMKGEQIIPALTFDDFSRLLNLGVGPFVVSLLFSTILSFVLTPLLMLPLFGISVAIPLILQSGVDEATALFTVLALVILMTVLFYVMIVVLAIPGKVILIYSERNPALNDSFKSLSLSYVWGFIKVAWRELIVATILLNLVSFVLGVVGMLLFFVGIYPVAILTMAAHVHYRSQIYAAYLARGGAPLPSQALDGGPPSPAQAFNGGQPFVGAGGFDR